jgi:hypothetical protein
MNNICAAEPCPVILNSTCVFYRGANLIYTGVLTNDNLQTVIEKIDNKFKNAAIGYIFNNGVVQAISGGPVQLGGSLVQDTTIDSDGFDLTITETVNAGKFVTIGGTSSQFVKGDGSLDSTTYQTAGNYITALTGDGTASGPGSSVFTLSPISAIYAGTWGSSTQVPQFTLDSKGRITGVTNVLISTPPISLSFIGNVFGSGFAGSPITLTINNTNPNVYGTITPLKFSVNNKGLITGASPITNLDLDGIYGYTPVPSSRTITINGVTHDLSVNRSWTISSGGTVSSVSVTAGTGISASVTNPTTTPNITITNTAPDQTVVLNSGTGISVTGTYPNFTITATGAGGVTSVTASSPLASSGGTTPNITIQQASGSQAGYLSSADWTTFNSKQNAITLTTTGTSGASTFIGNTLNIPQYTDQYTGTVTSVGLSAGTGISLSGTNPITSSGTITVTNSAPDQTVVLTGGTGISVSGTYPSFTITNSSPFTSPLTTKGDIYVRNGSADTRLPIGLDTQILIADSTTTTGMKWGTNTAATPTGYYGAWQDTNTQTALASNVGYPMIFNTTDLSNGVTMVSDGSNLTRITFANTGIYNIQFSVQIQNVDNAEHDVTIWIRKNGVDVPGSAGFVQVPKRRAAGAGNEGHIITGWNYVLSIVAGEYYQIIWSTTNAANVTLQYYAAGNPPPSTASTLVTVTQQSGIMAGTGMTALNGLTGAVQTFTDDTNVTMVSSGTAHAITWSGTLADSRIASASTWNAKQAALSGTGIVKSTAGTISYLTDNTANWDTAYTNRITSLTTTGSSGSATLVSNTLNIPTYTLSGLGGQPQLNGTGFVKASGTTISYDNSTYLTSVGTGVTNEITYWSGTNAIGSLSTSTYPSLTELSYVKGVTSAIQTQLNAKQASGNYLTDDPVLLGQQALGSTIKGVGLGCRSLANLTTSLAMTDGQIYLSAYYLPFSATITGAKWFQITAGVYTADNYNGIGLYTYSGGTLTLVASSTDDGTIWKNTGAQSKAFSSPYSASAGVYYIGFLYNSSAQTTAPSLVGAQNKSSGTYIDFTNSAKINATLTAATLTTPVAMSSTTGVQATWGMFLY